MDIPPGFDIPVSMLMGRVEKGLAAIQADFITQLQKRSPRSSATMQDAWQAGMRSVTMSEAVATVVNTQEYAHYVINGTEPARANPGGFIVPWVEKKLAPAQQYKIARNAGMSEKAARAALQRSNVKFRASALAVSVAFIIGRARMKRGSKGNDFVTPIIDENTTLWAQVLDDYLMGVFS